MDLCPLCSAPLTGRIMREASPEDPLRARRKEVRELQRCDPCQHLVWRREGDASPWSDGGPILPEHDYLFATLQPLPEPWAVVEDPNTRAELEAQLRTEVAHGHPLSGKKVVAIARCGCCDEVVYSVEGDPGWFARVHLTWRSTPERPPWPWTERLSPPLTKSLLDHEH